MRARKRARERRGLSKQEYAFVTSTSFTASELSGMTHSDPPMPGYRTRPSCSKPSIQPLILGAEVAAGIVAFSWIATRSLAGIIVWIVVYGFLSGMTVTLPAIVLPYITPSMSVLGTRLGMVYAVRGVSYLISTPVALALNHRTNGFLGTQVWMGSCCIAAVMFYAMVAREARKRRKLYEANGANTSLWRKRRNEV
jgi:MFS family permease